MSVLPPGMDVPDPIVRRAASDLNEAAVKAHEALPAMTQGILDALVSGRPGVAQTLINQMQGDLVELNSLVSRATGHQLREAGRRSATIEPDMREEHARDWCRKVADLMPVYNGGQPYGADAALKGVRS